jgi:hypothetical protein
VTTPWTANTTTKLTATLTGKVRTRTLTVAAPYDGTLTVSPRKTGSAATSVSVSLLAKGSTIGTSGFKSATGRSITTTACGQRSFGVRLKLGGTVTKTTKTTVSLTVSTP